LLKNVEVVDADEVSTDKVSFGSKVKIHDMEEDEDLEYQIVGSKEANILQNRISNESPVGKALLGSRVGDTVSVEIPAGILKYKVLSIERAS
ncbi:MAG: GreA/GreB family elongation factor, partial [Oribacterium sp.]|nr:GreA/GreB family elongation factor [Oribacterium sp.]